MQKRKFEVWFPVFLSLSMVVGMLLGYKMRDSIPGKSFLFNEHNRPIQEIMDLIENNYVDSVSTAALADTAIDAMLQKLDPHSVFIPASELQQVNEELSGGFFGIGIEFNIFDDTVHVINALKDGPGFRAGLQTGDKILKAGDSILAGRKLTSDEIRKVLKGKQGSQVIVTILRDGKQLNFTIIRDMIPLSSVDASFMVDSKTGFIRLNKFSQQTYREFMENLDTLKAQGAQNIILDLRGNGGGVLDEAVEIADEFLDGDKLVTYTVGIHMPRKEYRCRRLGQFESGRIAVLTDEGTASASEILAGAIQDWERGVIIGRRTFGKGLVQEQFDLSDHSALRLTVARYYTPLGRSIQRSYSNGGKAYYEEISNRYTDGEYLHEDAGKNDTTKKYKTIKGKILYGGGGISPDYFISGDTGRMGEFSTKVFMSGLVSSYGYRLLLQDPSMASHYSSPEDFAKNFSFSTNNWNFFLQMAAKDSINISNISPTEKEYLTTSLKRSVARQLWHNEGYYRMLNADDKAVKKALEILEK